MLSRVSTGLGCLFAMLTGVNGCGADGAGDPANSYPFRVGVAERGRVAITIDETGIVEPERQIVVKSPISGVARTLHVREGDSVSTGQLLAVIVPDIAQANALAQLQSEISAAELSLGNARREYERAQALQVGSSISEAEVEERRVALGLAENRLTAAREGMSWGGMGGGPRELWRAAGFTSAGSRRTALPRCERSR